MFNRFRTNLALTAAGLGTAIVLTNWLPAAEPDIKALSAQLEVLEKENQKLIEQAARQRSRTAPADVRSDAPLNSSTVEKIVGDMLKKKDEEKKKQEDEKKAEDDAQKAADDAQKKAEADRKKADGYEVGSELGMTASWTPLGVLFSTPNKDFQFHVGGRIDYDNVWWKEPPFLQGTAPGGNLGSRQFAGPIPAPAKLPAPIRLGTNVGTTGDGVLEDGTFFRRARIQANGIAYQVMEWNIEYDFFNPNYFQFDGTYVGLRDLPYIGTFRAGFLKVPQGLESYSATKFIPTMERSGLYDAFFQEYASGFYVTNSILDQRMTWHFFFGRANNEIAGNPADFGTGQYKYTTRITGLPLYQDDGRYLVHLGLSYQYREGQNDASTSDAGGAGLPGTPLAGFVTNSRVVRFRDRTGLRDAVGLGTLAEGDGARFIDTGNIIANGVNTTAGELLAYMGPFWLQSEATWANVPNATYPAQLAPAIPASKTSPFIPARFLPVQRVGTLNYWGYYVMAGYFLTGENRGYDRRFGSYDRVRPNENFFLVRGDDGKPQFGWGAVELVYRWSYIDLDSRGVDGGRLGEHTFGINWHLNPNAKIMLNYIVDNNAFNTLVPTFAATGGALTYSNVRTGQVQGLGLRFHLDF